MLLVIGVVVAEDENVVEKTDTMRLITQHALDSSLEYLQSRRNALRESSIEVTSKWSLTSSPLLTRHPMAVI